MFEAAADLQYALNFEGRDLTDDEAYRHLLPKYGISPDVFYKELHAPLYEKAALEEFNLVKKLQISGFPAVLLQTPDNRIHVIAVGYTDYETMRTRMDHALAALG